MYFQVEWKTIEHDARVSWPGDVLIARTVDWTYFSWSTISKESG